MARSLRATPSGLAPPARLRLGRFCPAAKVRHARLDLIIAAYRPDLLDRRSGRLVGCARGRTGRQARPFEGGFGALQLSPPGQGPNPRP